MVGTGDAGGVGRYERMLLRAIERLGPSRALELRTLLRSQHPEYLRTGERGGPGAGPTGLARFTAQSIRAILLGRPTLVVFTHVNLARVGGVLNRAGWRGRYVVLAHGVEVWGAMSPLTRDALRRAAAVVATTGYTRERLVRVQGVDAQRVSVVPLALDDGWLEAAEAAAPPAEAAAAARPVLLSVGRLAALEQYKGIDAVIEALPAIARAVPEVTYRVVGTGDDLERLQALARDRGVADHVEFAGARTHAELLEEYAGCDVFVLPSKGEGFGIVYLEAMAFGKPVVASAVGGPTDVIDDACGVLVDDDAQLADVLTGLLKDPERRRRLGDAGRRRAAERYSFAAYASRLGAFLDAMLAPGVGAPAPAVTEAR